MSTLDGDDYQAVRPGLQGRGHIVYEEVTPFSLSQRLNRLRFACYGFAATIVFVLLSVLAWVLLKGTLGAAATPWITFATLVLALAFFGYYVSLVVRRLHDIGRNGFWAMLIFAPALEPLALNADSGLLLLFVLLLQPFLGVYLLTQNPHPVMNQFGTPNPPNSMLVKIFGGFSWAVSMSLLVVQIVIAVLVVMQPERLDPIMERLERVERQAERLLR